MSTDAGAGRSHESSGGADPPDGGQVRVHDTAAEAERLRHERDAAGARAARDQRKAQRGGVVRRIFVGALVVLFALLVPITATSAWAHRTVLDTDTYISTVAPIAKDPAVTAAVSRRITDQLYTSLDPQQVIAGALPPKASFLAGPIANGAKGSIQSAVNRVLSSSQFQQLWVSANRFAHAQLVTVLRGDSTVLQTTKGQVVLNLVPLVNEAMKNAQTLVSGVVGKTVTLPAIKGDELPSAACQRIAAAIDRPVPSTCGQIPLFPAAKLTKAQDAVRAFDRAVLALLIVTPLVAVVALWVSRRRRRTLLQLSIGAMLLLVVVRRVVMRLQDQLVDAAQPANREARSAIVHQLLNGFFGLTWWILLGGLVVVALALVTGPYRWAVATRGAVTAWGRSGAELVGAAVRGGGVRAEDEATVSWIRRHLDLLRVAGVVVAAVLLLAVDVNVWWLLVIAALLALYEVGLQRLGSAHRGPEPPRGAPPPPPVPRVPAG